MARIVVADANAASDKSNAPAPSRRPPQAIVKQRRAAPLGRAIVREKLAPTVGRGRLDVIVFESGAE